MITLNSVESAKNHKLNRLVSALEDQDKLLEGLTDNMPACQEKKDLIKIKRNILNLIAKAEKML